MAQHCDMQHSRYTNTCLQNYASLYENIIALMSVLCHIYLKKDVSNKDFQLRSIWTIVRWQMCNMHDVKK